MAGRRAQPPASVDALSLASTGDGPTDRVMKQAEQAVQDLQNRLRGATTTLEETTTALGDLADLVAALPGRFVGRQVLTGSGTYTPTAGATIIVGRMCGGGGGGGGATAGPGAVSVGAGGASGVTIEFTTAAATTAFAAGAGGAGGSAAGGAGAPGGDSTFGAFLAKAGGGGLGGTQNGVAGSATSGQPLTGSTAGPMGAWAGGYGILFGVTVGSPGDGGGSPFGHCGHATAANVAPAAAFGFGAGGGGAASVNANTVGGAGAPGIIIVMEYS